MKSTHAQAAAQIRKELKTAFPTVKFTVRSESFSMGNSVDVIYVDGPKVELVEAIVGKFQYGKFDGSDDSYNYTNKIEGLPQVRFVHVERRPSAETKQNIAEELGIEPAEMNNWNPSFGMFNSEMIYKEFADRNIGNEFEDDTDPEPDPVNPEPTNEGPDAEEPELVDLVAGAQVSDVNPSIQCPNRISIFEPLFDEDDEFVLLQKSVSDYMKTQSTGNAKEISIEGLGKFEELRSFPVQKIARIEYPNTVSFDLIEAQNPGFRVVSVDGWYVGGEDWHHVRAMFSPTELSIWSPAEVVQRIHDNTPAEVFTFTLVDGSGNVIKADCLDCYLINEPD